MKGFALMLFLLGVIANAADLSSIQDLKHCVVNLRVDAEGYRKYIPSFVYEFDRRLHGMVVGINYLDENAKLLESVKVNEHLIGNAIVGCETHSKRLKAYIQKFFLFAGTGLLLSLLMFCYGIYGFYDFSGEVTRRKIPLSDQEENKPPIKKCL